MLRYKGCRDICAAIIEHVVSNEVNSRANDMTGMGLALTSWKCVRQDDGACRHKLARAVKKKRRNLLNEQKITSLKYAVHLDIV